MHTVWTKRRTIHLSFWSSLFDWQLEEANDLLRAESDTAARLRKSHTEMAKSMSQLESLNRELQERSRAVDGEKAQLEKELLLLQSTLDSERRNYSQGSEEIRELQGEAQMMTLTTLQSIIAWPKFVMCIYIFFIWFITSRGENHTFRRQNFHILNHFCGVPNNSLRLVISFSFRHLRQLQKILVIEAIPHSPTDFRHAQALTTHHSS